MAKFPPKKDPPEGEGPKQQQSLNPESPAGSLQQTPDQMQKPQELQMVQEQAIQPDAMQAADQTQSLAQPMQLASQALMQVAQIMDSDPQMADPAKRELVEKMMIAASRLAQEFGSMQPQQTPGAGMVPPALTGAPSPGMAPQVQPAPSGGMGAPVQGIA